MIALWMVFATLITSILAIGAVVFDRASAGALKQRRGIWVVALVLSATIPALAALESRFGRSHNAVGNDQAQGRLEKVSGASASAAAQALIADLISRAEPESLGRFDAVLGGVWVAAALLAVVVYSIGARGLSRRRRFWRPAQVDGEAVLVAPATGPAVIGAVRPVIVVPEWSLDLSAEHRALMLEHERQHVDARDPLLLHAAAAVAVLMPWNLAAWWLNRRLRLAVELDCDARVLATGRDARTYGNLLLEVCSRRLPTQPVLAPALFERTSSLTRRILAMHPTRAKYARMRATLGAAAAVALVVLACDVPAPEVVAPDGSNQATKRLYGKIEAAGMQSTSDTRAIVLKYFPTVAQGAGGPTILYLVKSATGAVVLTESQPAGDAMRTRVPVRDNVAGSVEGLRERKITEDERQRVELRERAAARPFSANARLDEPRRDGVVKISQRGGWVSSAIGALHPEDISSVDVLKQAAGTVAPNAISLVTIILKPGAALPTTEQR